tara:strand:+ start:882 stop:1136 length:255 start_codon:yes stop_codon:yes gene_type:complete
MFGARRNDIPWEPSGEQGTRNFEAGRSERKRMAGDLDLSGLIAGKKASPHGIGFGKTPDTSTPWERFLNKLDYEQEEEYEQEEI